jgi:hypothetical protein
MSDDVPNWWPKREDWPSFDPVLFNGKLYRTGIEEAISLLILEEYIILLNASDVCGLFVNCSDTFAYACADGEPIPPVGFRQDELVWKLYDMIKDYGYLGAVKWVSIQRKMLPLKEYRDGLVEAGLWCEELQRFAEGE